MKRHITYMLFATVALGMIGSTMSNSFADDATVSIPSGTSVPGCEETNDCFAPYEVKVNPGDTVTWSNDDTAAHTVTSGMAPNSDGKFDSGLFAAGTTFSHTFDNFGTYDYFCIVHPWMESVVTVQKVGSEDSGDKSETKSDDKTMPEVITGIGEEVVEGAEDVGEKIVE